MKLVDKMINFFQKLKFPFFQIIVKQICLVFEKAMVMLKFLLLVAFSEVALLQ